MNLTDILFGKAIHGGGGESIKAMLIESADDVDWECEFEGIPFFRISTDVPTVEEMRNAILLANESNGGGAVRLSNITIEDASAEIGFTFYQVYSGVPLILVIGEDIPDEGAKAGTYMSSNHCMFPYVNGLIFGV